MPVHPSTHLTRRTAATLCALLALAGCAKSEDSAAPQTQGTGGAQVAQTPAGSGPECTLQQYGGSQLDLKNAVVGFAQSEKEANPFRIAETQSIKDEAAKVGVKQLLTTNANSQLSKPARTTWPSSAPTSSSRANGPRRRWPRPLATRARWPSCSARPATT